MNPNIIIALGTAAVLAIAFIINSRVKRKKPAIDDLWTAEGYFNYLLAVIKASRDMLDLESAWFMVENTWFTKTFRFPVNRFTRNRLYSVLAEAYAEKETELTKVKVELCPN